MRKFLGALAGLVLFCAVIFLLTRGNVPREEAHYNELQVNGHALDMIVLNQHDEQAQPEYYTVCEAGKVNKTEPFESDPVRIYEADIGCFQANDGENRQKQANVCAYMALKDENGEAVEVTPTFEQIFRKAAENEHRILVMNILQMENEIYVSVELNVNWWAPCILNYYDEEKNELVKITTQDDVKYVGLRARPVKDGK